MGRRLSKTDSGILNRMKSGDVREWQTIFREAKQNPKFAKRLLRLTKRTSSNELVLARALLLTMSPEFQTV